MANLIPMEEAAAMLGMTVEQLTELRSNNEIFGYRDGSTWKFKMAEIERVAADLNVSLKGGQASIDFEDDDFELSDESDLIEADSDELIGDGSSSMDILLEDESSVEIAKVQDSSSSDIVLEDDSIELGLKFDDSADDLVLEGSAEDILASDEGVTDEKEDLSFGSSSLSLAGSSKKLLASDTGSDVLAGDEPGEGSPSDTGKLLGGDDMLLGEDDLFADDLGLADSGSFEESAELDSDFEDSELELEDSDSSTEIVLEANEGGISLSPNESGIELEEEPLELGGSDIDQLELPEDDDMIVLDDAADADSATLMQEDDFNLTPLEESLDDDSSGSQVIALEDSDIYTDDSEPAILADSADLVAQPAMLVDDNSGAVGMGGGMGMAPYGGAGAMIAPGAVALPEAPYSVWQVVSLGLVALLLTTGGIICYDVARNMWMPEDAVIGNSLLNFFLDLVGMNKMQ